MRVRFGGGGGMGRGRFVGRWMGGPSFWAGTYDSLCVCVLYVLVCLVAVTVNVSECLGYGMIVLTCT